MGCLYYNTNIIQIILVWVCYFEQKLKNRLVFKRLSEALLLQILTNGTTNI